MQVVILRKIGHDELISNLFRFIAARFIAELSQNMESFR